MPSQPPAGPPDETEQRLARLLDAGDVSAAAAAAVRAYGPGVLGYLSATLRDPHAADEVFGTFCEDLVRGLPGFRRESSLRTWAYRLAWHAAMRHLRDPHQRRRRPLATDAAEALAQEVRTNTALHLRTSSKDALAALRAALTPQENTLLILRIDRGLAWGDIADVLASDDGERPAEAALRKRFERLTDKLRKEAVARGLLPGG